MAALKTTVLDDDPTGTQAASGVAVLFNSDPDLLVDALRITDAIYLQANGRAIGRRRRWRWPAASDWMARKRLAASDDRALCPSRRLTVRGQAFAESAVIEKRWRGPGGATRRR